MTSYLIVGLLGYLLLLLAIATFGQKQETWLNRIAQGPWVYTLSLAVYCTSWTFFGIVGAATRAGSLYLAIYWGPMLGMILGSVLLNRIFAIKRTYHITSIADFISTRYYRSASIAALVTLFIALGVAPYIALQLKAISLGFRVLSDTASAEVGFWGVEEFSAIFLVAFTILFGLRRLDISDHHPGVILAMAFEGLVKIVAFVALGLFVTFGLFDGLGDLFSQAESLRNSSDLFDGFNRTVPMSTWICYLFLSMNAFFFLPRQFQVMVVENTNPEHLKTAQWALPTYLFLITLFVIPVVLGALLLGFPAGNADSFVLLLPQQYASTWLTFFIYIGGFSASMGMVVMSTIAISVMVSNHLVLPVIERFSVLVVFRRHLLPLRWAVVAIVVSIGYLFNRYVGNSEFLASMGILSFAAVLQFTPAAVGGLIWSKASRIGALFGICSGFAFWMYCLFLPALVDSGILSLSEWLAYGPWELDILAPRALMGMEGIDPISHGVFWSFSINVAMFCLGSILFPGGKEEQQYYKELQSCFSSDDVPRLELDLQAYIDLNQRCQMVRSALEAYLAHQKVDQIVKKSLLDVSLLNQQQCTLLELNTLRKNIERNLAGSIGTTAAHGILERCEFISAEEQAELREHYSELLNQLSISPYELQAKLNYYQERELMIEQHSLKQSENIELLERQVERTKSAEKKLQEFNQQLEHIVEERTVSLQDANQSLKITLEDLKHTQDQLIESEKMASLGALVKGIAHEINTPVGVSITGVSSVQDKTANVLAMLESNKLQKQSLEQYLSLTQHSLDLVMNNLMSAAELVGTFKKVAVDNEAEQASEFELGDYVKEVLSSLASDLNQADIVTEVDCVTRIPMNASASIFYQIITNLTHNSIKHGFELPNKQGERQIRIMLSQDENNVMIEFKDTGVGVDEALIGQIFDPFVTSNRGQGGTGLGAHIVYNLVTSALKGSITANNIKGGGLAITISIPNSQVSPLDSV